MANIESKITRKRLANAYLSSVFSISLVLLMVGMASLLIVNAANVSNYFKEHMEVSVIFKTDVPDGETLKFERALSKKPYVCNIEYVSREQGINEMKALLGEDFLSVFDTAPIPVSLNLSLKAEFVTSEQIEKIMQEISSDPRVEDVVWQESLIDALNANLHKISLILGLFILLLLFISLVLISNTVRLNLYSKRFNIHTMRLVGATKGFIMKPFLVEAVFQGIISALFAIMLLLGVLILLKRQFELLFTVFQLKELLLVMLIMVGGGLVICVLSSLSVVSRMISLKKQELYF